MTVPDAILRPSGIVFICIVSSWTVLEPGGCRTFAFVLCFVFLQSFVWFLASFMPLYFVFLFFCPRLLFAVFHIVCSSLVWSSWLQHTSGADIGSSPHFSSFLTPVPSSYRTDAFGAFCQCVFAYENFCEFAQPSGCCRSALAGSWIAFDQLCSCYWCWPSLSGISILVEIVPPSLSGTAPRRSCF